MIAALLSIWLAAPNAPAGAADAPRGGACLSHSEAKRVYRGAYLHWRRGTHGRRCWADRRVRTPAREVGVAALPDETQRPKNGPLLFVNHPDWAWDVSHGTAEQELDRRWPQFHPQKLTSLDRTIEFSTFSPGEEPDVWPQIETAAPMLSSAGRGAAVGGLLAALAIWSAWLLGPGLFRALLGVGVRPARPQ